MFVKRDPVNTQLFKLKTFFSSEFKNAVEFDRSILPMNSLKTIVYSVLTHKKIYYLTNYSDKAFFRPP